MTSEAQKKAVKKYKEKVKRVTLEFSPAEMELYEHIRAQEKKQTYIKDLIRADMEPGRWECEHETWGKLQCSICKKEALLEEINDDRGTSLLYVTSNFCPNCGAKMDYE